MKNTWIPNSADVQKDIDNHDETSENQREYDLLREEDTRELSLSLQNVGETVRVAIVRHLYSFPFVFDG